MEFIPHLGFNGNCREAFGFYAEVFGVTVDCMIAQGEIPDADKYVDVASRDKIMHAALSVGGGTLYGADSCGGHYEKPTGFMVTIMLPDAAEGQRIFDALADGGEVRMPYEETFWVERFGMLVDRFGTPWAINGGPSKM